MLVPILKKGAIMHTPSVCIITIDEELKNIFVSLAHALGIRLIDAATLNEALDHFTLKPFDGALIDANLPNSAGIDLLNRCSQKFGKDRLVIIVKKPISEKQAQEILEKFSPSFIPPLELQEAYK